jgi:ubiquinone/menaquinone biosynthesis C-methylase UbiE
MPFNHFNFIAPYYDRFLSPGDPGRFTERLGLPISGMLLDAAGGTGGKSYPLVDLVSAIVVADSSVGMLHEASKNPGLKAVCAETETLPFLAGSFETIIMVDAFHHVSDYRATAQELWRVLKAGGRIVIEEPDIRRLPVKVMAVFEKLTLMRSNFKSPSQIADIFKNLAASVSIELENTTAGIVIIKQIS